MKKIKIKVVGEPQRQRVIGLVRDLPLEPVYQVIISEVDDTRTILQNDKLHAMLTDISKQVEYFGRKYPVTVWKRLCTAAYLREKGEDPWMIPAIDGVGVDIIYEKTSNMGVKMVAELIEFVYAFGAEREVVWKEKVSEERNEQ